MTFDFDTMSAIEALTREGADAAEIADVLALPVSEVSAFLEIPPIHTEPPSWWSV